MQHVCNLIMRLRLENRQELKVRIFITVEYNSTTHDFNRRAFFFFPRIRDNVRYVKDS